MIFVGRSLHPYPSRHATGTFLRVSVELLNFIFPLPQGFMPFRVEGQGEGFQIHRPRSPTTKASQSGYSLLRLRHPKLYTASLTDSR